MTPDEAGALWDRMLRDVPDAVMKFANVVGIEAVNEARRAMRASPAGAPRHPASRGFASLPGNPPRVDTGQLISSITHEVGRNGDTVYVAFGTNVQHGAHTEFGTSTMAPRPWARPTAEVIRTRLPAMVAAALEEWKASFS